MNIRQINKKLKKSLFHDYEIKGRKIYSYRAIINGFTEYVFTARPKQKGCRAYSEKYIIEELCLYGHKAAYELISQF